MDGHYWFLPLFGFRGPLNRVVEVTLSVFHARVCELEVSLRACFLDRLRRRCEHLQRPAVTSKSVGIVSAPLAQDTLFSKEVRLGDQIVRDEGPSSRVCLLGLLVTSGELSCIAAAVIGGMRLQGGVGRLTGVVMGALITTSVVSGLILIGVEPNWQQIVVAALIAIAVGVQGVGALGRAGR